MRRPIHRLGLWIAVLSAGFASAASTRCDLVSQAPKCVDLSATNGAALQLPSNTTRIPVAGLSICGIPGSAPQPTDIVYAVDQTGSMVPQAIYTSAEDTAGFYDCNTGRNLTSPVLTYTGSIPFHGNTVKIIDKSQWTLAQVKSVCNIAGDPYSVRSSTLQAALQSQSQKEPGSNAATISFGPGVIVTQDSMSGLPAGLAPLQGSVPLAAYSGTNYEATLIWARILLYGGHSGAQVIPPSSNPNKAIVIISDGRPTTGTWQNYYKAHDTVNIQNSAFGGADNTWRTWRTDDSVNIPPVYGIYLGQDAIEGSVLQALADSTKGEYHMIPPNMPDSLALIIQQILGRLVKQAKPDSLTIRNETNGQTSLSTTFDSSGAGYRIRLDSLIGLQPGENQLTLTLKEKGRLATANWTVRVSDATTGTTKGLDSLLTTRCGPPSRLVLTPDKSGLPWADTNDRNVLIGLNAYPEGGRGLPIVLTTAISSDREAAVANVPATANPDSSGTFGGSVPWQELAAGGPVVGDIILRSGPGWDTAVGWFQMPRDARDTASARLALHRTLADTHTVVVQPTTPRLRFLDDQNGVHDSLGFDLAVGAQKGVRVQLWLGSAFCPTCGGLVDIVPSDPGIGIDNSAGASVTSMRLVGGEIMVVVKGVRPVVSGQILFHSDSIGAGLTARPVRVLPPAPDSVVYLDSDGDGRMDRAQVHMPAGSPWMAGMEVQLPWPDSTRWLPVRTANLSCSPDTLVTTYDLDPQGKDTTTWAYPLNARWRWSTAAAWQTVPVKERLAAVPVRAVLLRGSSYDTLRIWTSESLWPSFTPLDSLVGRKAGASDSAVVPHSARIETATGALILLIPSDSTYRYVQVGDSVRFLSSIRDVLGNTPGRTAKHVVVSGADAVPSDAVMLDADADGRADRLVLRLRAPFSGTDSIGVFWPDTSGALERRSIPVQGAVSDSGGFRVTIDLDPFAFGATSCPAAGCGNLGYLASRGSNATIPFTVRDGVDPIPEHARYAFSASPSDPDTLVAYLSERVDSAGSGPWLSVGRQTSDSLGISVQILADTTRIGASRKIARHVALTDGGRVVRILLDRSFPGRVGDSLRISSSTISGALSDPSGNRPGRLAYWTLLDYGAPPPGMVASLPHPLVKLGDGTPPPNEPAITPMVHPASDSASWQALEGITPDGTASRFGGIRLRLNRIPTMLGLYIYDNMGVPVLSQDFPNWDRAQAEGRIQRSARGDYELWLAWDGKDQTGQTVGSGVYFVRVFGWIAEGSKVYMLNSLQSQGFKRDVPPPW